MEKKVILISFIIPLLLLIVSIILAINAADGYTAIGAGIAILMSIISAVVVIIALVILRSKQLVWWHGILISISSFIVMIGIIQILVLFNI